MNEPIDIYTGYTGRDRVDIETDRNDPYDRRQCDLDAQIDEDLDRLYGERE